MRAVAYRIASNGNSSTCINSIAASRQISARHVRFPTPAVNAPALYTRQLSLTGKILPYTAVVGRGGKRLIPSLWPRKSTHITQCKDEPGTKYMHSPELPRVGSWLLPVGFLHWTETSRATGVAQGSQHNNNKTETFVPQDPNSRTIIGTVTRSTRIWLATRTRNRRNCQRGKPLARDNESLST